MIASVVLCPLVHVEAIRSVLTKKSARTSCALADLTVLETEEAFFPRLGLCLAAAIETITAR